MRLTFIIVTLFGLVVIVNFMLWFILKNKGVEYVIQ